MRDNNQLDFFYWLLPRKKSHEPVLYSYRRTTRKIITRYFSNKQVSYSVQKHKKTEKNICDDSHFDNVPLGRGGPAGVVVAGVVVVTVVVVVGAFVVVTFGVVVAAVVGGPSASTVPAFISG